MKLIFFGASRYVIPVLQTLDFSLVITTETDPGDPVRKYCTEHAIPCINVPDRIDEETMEKILSFQSPVAILASFGIIVPQKILNLFPKGILNIHPSLLPKYRGPTPVQTAILHGDQELGVTVIKLDAELDHGPIFAKSKRQLLSSDTSDAVYKELFQTGAEIIKSHLDDYLSGKQELLGQDHSRATYTDRLTRESGFFNFNNPPTPVTIDKMIRAYYPWPGVWTKIQMENGIWKILKFLPEGKLQVEGKKPMTIKDFCNGYPAFSQKIKNVLGE